MRAKVKPKPVRSDTAAVFLRLEPALAERLQRFIDRQRVRPTTTVILRTALEEFLDREEAAQNGTGTRAK